jgi:hypothetical protein
MFKYHIALLKYTNFCKMHIYADSFILHAPNYKTKLSAIIVRFVSRGLHREK